MLITMIFHRSTQARHRHPLSRSKKLRADLNQILEAKFPPCRYGTQRPGAEARQAHYVSGGSCEDCSRAASEVGQGQKDKGSNHCVIDKIAHIETAAFKRISDRANRFRFLS